MDKKKTGGKFCCILCIGETSTEKERNVHVSEI